MLWPTWMDDAGLMAKSTDKGGQTLAMHTWQVLCRLADHVKLRPDLPQLLNDERLWHRMYWACFLHDFGKAALEFQEVLQKKSNLWKERRQRHEILSLGFVDWLFPKGHIDREWIIAVIAFHHKDLDVITGQYGGDKVSKKIDNDEWESIDLLLSHLAEQISLPVRQHLWRWIDACSVAWAKELNIPLIESVQLCSWEEAAKTNLRISIFRALRTFNEWNGQIAKTQKTSALLTRGLILTADHAASGDSGVFPPMPLTMEKASLPLRGKVARDHQRAAAQANFGSAILVAPTGSGKTEAALMWAARQMEIQPAARLFYTLPYQASMNAMYERLATRFLGYTLQEVKQLDCKDVTIQHSRALLKLYQDAMALDEMAPKQREAAARRLRNLAQLNTFPIQIFSPYQMLKAAYSLKGYETLLLDYTQGLFIFDEIHAYDPKRLALIIELMRWLREKLSARFFVMTATLPPPVFERLKDALGVTEDSILRASVEEFKRSQRHIVYLLDGKLGTGIVERVASHRGKMESVLICLNRVADAQRVYDQIMAALKLEPNVDIVLLHGKFNGEDRQKKEEILLDAVGVDSALRKPLVVVATQVVEVSLNVDFDTIYSDPAPLEALLQRFGRVNRGRGTAPLCPVYVFREPDSSGKKPYMPYDEEMVRQSVSVLEEYCAGKTIDESLVTTLLEKIYTGTILAQWEKEYLASAASFRSDILGKMIPFQSAHREDAAQFYKLFDGVEVLPAAREDAYNDFLDTKQWLDARKYLVNISHAQYIEFFKYGRIKQATKLEGAFADIIDVDYDDEYGLRLDEARQAEKQPKVQDYDW